MLYRGLPDKEAGKICYLDKSHKRPGNYQQADRTSTMPVYLNKQTETRNQEASKEATSSESSLKLRFGLGSILVWSVIASVVLAGIQGSLTPAAVRLIVLLFAGQWLFAAIQVLQGRSNLFIDRSYYAVCALGKIARVVDQTIRQRKIVEPGLNPTEKVSLLFWIVKLIFIPFLLSVATSQADHLVPIFTSGKLPELLTSFPMIYIIWLAVINLLDTVVATLGYAIESKSLGNEVRSVDTSIVSWLAVLSCYPPCWIITRTLIPINASPFFSASVDNFVDVSVRVLILIFLTLFTVATFNLNVHFSNLCHRGLVSSGLYSIVRHPAYSCKLIAWGLVIAYLSWSNLTMWCHYLIWIALYVTRAITEERHLSKVDQDYVEYCRRVKYRFIPGLI